MFDLLITCIICAYHQPETNILFGIVRKDGAKKVELFCTDMCKLL